MPEIAVTKESSSSGTATQEIPPQSLPRSPQAIALNVIVLLALSALLFFAFSAHSQPDTYTKSVLSLTGDTNKGRSIFVMNCMACHGQWANGKVGPSLRNISLKLSKSQIIHQVISGETPPMPQFQPDSQEMADLLDYLEQL